MARATGLESMHDAHPLTRSFGESKFVDTPAIDAHQSPAAASSGDVACRCIVDAIPSRIEPYAVDPSWDQTPGCPPGNARAPRGRLLTQRKGATAHRTPLRLQGFTLRINPPFVASTVRSTSMSQDPLFESLAQAAAKRSIGEDKLRAMLEDEVRTLSSGARVHDYILVFAMRHLRERMLSEDFGRDEAPPGYRAAEPIHASHGI
jgi:hypothetical protein